MSFSQPAWMAQDACAGGHPGRPGLLRRLFGRRPRRRRPQAAFESFAAAQGREEAEDAPRSIVILNLLSHDQLVRLLEVCLVTPWGTVLLRACFSASGCEQLHADA